MDPRGYAKRELNGSESVRGRESITTSREKTSVSSVISSREEGGEGMGRLTEGFLDVAAADQDFVALSVVLEEAGTGDSDTRTNHRSTCRPTTSTISNPPYLLRRRCKRLRWLTVRPGRGLKDIIHLPLHRARRLSLLLRMRCTIPPRYLWLLSPPDPHHQFSPL